MADPKIYQYVIFALIALTGYITYKGERDITIKDKYLLWVDRILIGREYIRLVSSGFLHNGWMHFGINMFVLYVFGPMIARETNIGQFLLLYFASMIGGSLLAVYFHRNHGDYRALGASGATSGVVYAAVFLDPTNQLSLLFLPFFSFPAWVFGLVYLLITLGGVRFGWGNIGHEAHLGGAITGLLLVAAMRPEVAVTNWWLLLLLLVPFCAFMWIALYRPHWMMVTPKFSRPKQKNSGGDRVRRNREPVHFNREAELNHLLDKVRNDGIESLSPKERQRLDELSGKL